MAVLPLKGAAAPLLDRLAASLAKYRLELTDDCRAAISSPAFLSLCAKLDQQQALFCMLYVATYDIDLAHNVSGIGKGQVTPETLLVVKAGIASRKETLDLAGHELAFELAAIAMSNLADIPPSVYEDGDIRGLPRTVTAAIRKIKPIKDGGFEIELYDKLRAIAQLNNMFEKAAAKKDAENVSRKKPVVRLLSSRRFEG